MTDKELVHLAKEASQNSHSPYSNFKVGAALLTKDGTIFKGTNVENASYGGTICAERTAFCTAVANGHKEFEKIAVYVAVDDFGMPCGICRQFMAEFVDDDFIVLCANKNEDFVSYKFDEVLPNAFRL